MNFKCFAFCLILATLTSALSPGWNIEKRRISPYRQYAPSQRAWNKRADSTADAPVRGIVPEWLQRDSDAIQY